MSWVTYRIEPTTDDTEALELLRSARFWSSCDYVFRNRGFPEEVVDQAFGSRGRQENEVTIRGLYITIKEPTLWESVRCFRRLWRARKRMETCEGLRPPTPLTT